MDAAKLAESLKLIDMAVACDHCGNIWWPDENWTPLIEDFHTDACPLKGRRDVHATFGVSYDYLDATCPRDHRHAPHNHGDCHSERQREQAADEGRDHRQG